jgi:hypothetical protein
MIAKKKGRTFLPVLAALLFLCFFPVMAKAAVVERTAYASDISRLGAEIEAKNAVLIGCGNTGGTPAGQPYIIWSRQASAFPPLWEAVAGVMCRYP